MLLLSLTTQSLK
uniref:Uncharacterized protein n=1 Tax=Moniliophthora roreri TaxID=221103 RepID=A0A0W0GFF0_MONRR